MPDERPKPAIPAWQRASTTPATEDPVSSLPVEAQPTPSATEPEHSTSGASPDTSPDGSSQTAIVQDPSSSSATEAPQSEQPSASAIATFNATDLEAFTQSSKAPVSQPEQRTVAAPPIITYPEFLARAHQPPPLITPSRVFNSLYIAGGLAALVYGTNRFLVQPMVETQTALRHDFLDHSRSKVDEFNERLGKIVSRIPDARANGKEGGAGANADQDDLESITSDPTELFHRDMGTQTDVNPPSSTPALDTKVPSDQALASSLDALSALENHLSSLVPTDSAASSSPSKLRREALNSLRHYLDTLQYASTSAINVWSTTDDTSKKDGSTKEEDAVEELKKEIRGIKGVLLSARRFPGWATGGTAGRSGMATGAA